MPLIFGSKSPASGSKPPSAPKPKSAWNTLRVKANAAASIIALFIFLIGAGSIGGYYYAQSKKPQTKSTTSSVQTLSPDELNKLGNITSNLGSGGQTLNIGADALFRGKANVVGDFTVGGHFTANGPVTLSQLAVADLSVSGTATLQNTLTVNGLATFAKGINVTGASSLDSLNSNTISVRNISISGPLTVGHLITQGPAPIIAENQVGAGGTVSISGNDTSGQVNINTGTGPGTTLATVTFRATFGTSVHVILSPITAPAAAAQAYATRNSGGFQIHANSAPAGSVLSYDYLVTQ
jgi:hypothetical protein